MQNKNQFIKLSILSIQLLFVLYLLGLMLFIGTARLSADNAPKNATPMPVLIFTGDNGRISKGLKIATLINSPAIYISGVNKEITPQRFLKRWASDAPRNIKDSITIDYEAQNTVENAKHAMIWLNDNGYKNALLITSDYHLQRAIAIVNALDTRNEIDITGLAVASNHLNMNTLKFWQIMQREYNKTLLTKACLSQTLLDCFP